MVLPIYATLEKMDETLLEAAADLGCPPWKAFWLVTVPLALPGVVAGALLCFIPIVGEFVIPDLLGGSRRVMIGQTLWTEFFSNRDWPVASAVAVVLLCLLIVPIVIYRRCRRATRRRSADAARAFGFNIVSVALGLAFLYLPIAILVIYSFNASRLVTVWGGWSTRWYASSAERRGDAGRRLGDRCASRSCRRRAATVLGTLAALALVRVGRFRGRLLFSGMIYAPLVMPEVITGLSLLLLFVAVEIDRGFWTIAIAHTTLTCASSRWWCSRGSSSFDRAWRRPRWISAARRCGPFSP